MWRVHETKFFLQRRDGARQFFFSWSKGSGYRPWNFLQNGIKLCFLKRFPADCIFLSCFFFFVVVFFFGGGGGCHQSPELEGLWLRIVFFMYRDYAWLRRSDDLPDLFKEKKNFFMKMRNSCSLSSVKWQYSVFSLVTLEIEGVWYWK